MAFSLDNSESFVDFFTITNQLSQKYSVSSREICERLDFEYLLFCSWMFQFDQLKRDEKVERVFLVLNSLLMLLENDLTIWMLKYGHMPYTALADKQKWPLIAEFLWQDAIGDINRQVKDILQLFVNYVSIGFARHKVEYLSVCREFGIIAVFQFDRNANAPRVALTIL